MVPEALVTAGLAASSSVIIPIITGPTASGKSAVALEIARELGGIELISADSIQVYRGFDIGSAKPSPAEQREVRHHLIDVRDPNQDWTAADFQRECEKAIVDCQARGNRAVIVGGTGFYLKALLFGLWDAPPRDPGLRAELAEMTDRALLDELRTHDPVHAQRVETRDRYRLIRALEILKITGKKPSDLEAAAEAREPDHRFQLVILDPEFRELEQAIQERTEMMLQNGWLEEVRALQQQWPRARALESVGYREIVAYLENRTPPGRKPLAGVAGLTAEICLATRQLVKSQRTFFRGQFGKANPNLVPTQKAAREVLKSLLNWPPHRPYHPD